MPQAPKPASLTRNPVLSKCRNRSGLIGSNGFSDAARIVQLSNTQDSHVIGEKLKRNNLQDGKKKIGSPRYANHLVDDGWDQLVSFIDQRDHFGRACFQFLEIRKGFLVT